MGGEFCTVCGTPARTANAPAVAGPTQSGAGPVQAAPASRKTSPLVWIMVAVLGLFVLFGIAVFGTGIFLVHKAKQAGFNRELIRNNPTLAMAKLLAATNTDLEVVSSDEGRGLVTLRQRSTGKTLTVNLDDMKRGRITFTGDGKDSFTMEAHGSGDTGSLEMKSGSESLTMGAASQVTLPDWMPAYPSSKPSGIFNLNNTQGTSASFQFQTGDAPKDVAAYYERELKRTGFRINATTLGDSGTSSGGIVSADDQANKRTVLVTVASDAKGTTVSVTYSQK